jgi:hypothetical protein
MPTLNELIEEEVGKFEHSFYGANNPKIADIKDFLRLSLHSIAKAVMDEYEKNKKKEIKELAEYFRPDRDKVFELCDERYSLGLKHGIEHAEAKIANSLKK